MFSMFLHLPLLSINIILYDLLYKNDLIEKIKAKGIKIAYVTLHVGLGTFRPVVVENVLEHKMHTEQYIMDSETAKTLNEIKKNGGTFK